jgi:ABC-type uncharacterized transport system ATPase subunit
VHAGEIVGMAGVSGNGQMELMEILAGQRALQAGEVTVEGAAFGATRDEAQGALRALSAGRAAAQRLRAEDERHREHLFPQL